MRRRKENWIGWFLFGLGSQLQLFGTSLSFTELFIFAAAPLLFFSEWPYLRRNGMITFFWLGTAVFIGCCIGCVANHSPMFAVVRGLAVTILIPGTILVGHWMLRKDLAGYKWFIVGSVISFVLTTFIFHQAVDVNSLAGGADDKYAVEAIMSGPIYWIGRLGGILMAPAQGWYLQCPILYSIVAPLFLAGFAMMTSTSGRSAALGAIASAALVILGGKKRRTMKRVGRYFFLLIIVAVAGAFAAKNIYRYAALHDWLGEKAREKYELQTKGKSGMMALLLGGRMESFCGLIACVDRPIIGFGPWAMDRWGYVGTFLSKYADAEDSERYDRHRLAHPNVIKLIPCHSQVTEFWLWYGISGLVFWFYVVFVLARYLRQDCWAVPQWYMWLAAGIPSFCWNIFFSAWANRVGAIMFIMACLMARAVRKGRQPLPVDMVREICMADRD